MNIFIKKNKMKINLILLISLSLVTTTCTSQQKPEKSKNNLSSYQKTNEISKIELKEQTRGTNRSVTFNYGSIITSLNENISKSELSMLEWENIAKQASLINLSKISTYESPTTGRFSDRALASKIIITYGSKTYESSSFDEGIPPKELEGLYKLLKGKAGITKRDKLKLR